MTVKHEKTSPDGRPAEMYTGKMNVLKARQQEYCHEEYQEEGRNGEHCREQAIP